MINRSPANLQAVLGIVGSHNPGRDVRIVRLRFMAELIHTGDIVQHRTTRVAGRVECWCGRWALLVRITRNPTHDGRWPVGFVAWMLADELKRVGGFVPCESGFRDVPYTFGGMELSDLTLAIMRQADKIMGMN